MGKLFVDPVKEALNAAAQKVVSGNKSVLNQALNPDYGTPVLEEMLTPSDTPTPATAPKKPGPWAEGYTPPPGWKPSESVPDAVSVPPVTEESDENADASQWGTALNRVFHGDLNRVQQNIRREGSNFFPGGGEEGEALYEDTFKTKPAEVVQAVEQGADIEKQLQDSRAALIGKEKDRVEHQNAVIAERHAAQQQFIQQKQAEVEEKVQYYTNDLADTGKFWRNPGNIMAAFGAALMTLASDDHAIGYKLINNAIQQDLHHRQKLADMHLGELRSNLAGYRQIAGDEYTGDLLAEAEAKRVAAMELERLGAQFAGPKAKAAAAAMNKKLLMDVQNLRMHVYASMFYNRPEVMTKAMENAYSGYKPYAKPGQGGTAPATGGPVSMSLRQSNQSSGGVNPPARGKSAFAPSKQLLEYFDKRVPHASRVLPGILQNAAEEVYLETQSPPGTAKHTAGMIKYFKAAEAEVQSEKGQKLIEAATKQKVLSNVANKMALFEEGTRTAGGNPDDAIGWGRKLLPGEWAAKIADFQNKWDAMYPPGTPAGKANFERRKAIESVMREVAQVKLSAFHEQLGGAMSPQELELAKGMFDTNGTWQGIKDFINSKSAEAAMGTKGINLSPLGTLIAEGRIGKSGNFARSNTKGAASKKK